MGEIYSNARRVIVWFGLENYGHSSSDEALIAMSFLDIEGVRRVQTKGYCESVEKSISSDSRGQYEV
jgi:hypothetical protein